MRMRSVASMLCAAWIIWSAQGPAFGQAIAGRTTVFRPPEGFAVSAAFFADANADGRQDILLCAYQLENRKVRRLFVHLARADGSGIDPKAKHAIPILQGVLGIAVGDVLAGAGNEIICFGRRFAFAQRLSAPPGRPVRLFDHAFLWQLPDDDEIMVWQRGTRDLNGDGVTDVLIPEPDGYLAAIQSKAADGTRTFSMTRMGMPKEVADFGVEPRGALSMRGRRSRREVKVSMSVGGSTASRAPFLTMVESVPAPQIIDFDGDGRLDVVARTVGRLHVWSQSQAGRFSERPTRTHKVPVIQDRARILDVSYSAHLTDLNGDKRQDCVFIAGNERSRDVSTQVLAYTYGAKPRGPAATTAEAPLFGPRGLPHQLLVLAGFAAIPLFDDVDGNGYPDFSIVTFRPDLLDMMRSRSSSKIELGFHLFLNRKGRLSPRSDLNGRIVVSVRDFDSARSFLRLRYIADLNGDGLRELLVQSGPSEARIHAPRRGRRPILEAHPAWSHTWDGEGTVEVEPSEGPPVGALIVSRTEAIHVRWK